MARKATWPPKIYKHPCGQERVRIRGVVYYLGPHDSVEAKRRYLELVKKCEDEGLDKPPPKLAPKQRKAGLTVAEVVERHHADAKARYDPAGREAKQHAYSAQPLLDKFASLPVTYFTCARLEEVRDEMIRRGWQREVINRRIIRLRTLFRWAERKGLCPAGTWSALRTLEPLPRNDRRVKSAAPVKILTWPDFAKTCRMAPANVRDMLLTQLFGGMRSAEVRTMTAGEVFVEGDDWVYRPAKHKNAWRGHVRAVVLGPRCRLVLAKHLKDKQPGEYVFPSGRSGCYSDCTYPQAVARACERAGVAPWSPYDLRKLASIRAIRATSLDAARAMLGHASVTTTAQHYTDGQDMKLASEAAKKVG